MALDTSAERPVPVRTVAQAIAGWVHRLGGVWVEGQVTQVSRRPGAGTVFLTLRDPVAEVSLSLTCPRAVVDAVVPPLADGARVVVHGRPDVYLARGSLSLAVDDIRPVGVGELLARIERLKHLLVAEGLTAAGRKKPLPFLPRRVGLVTGRASAAERDVVENARRRWPAVVLEVREVAVQGPQAVAAVCAAVTELDRHAEVDVIVVARGGGSVEDLLPFSDETLCRVVAACTTPVVSAIGHEPDSPLLDLVADARASTPTDAGKMVVPDVAEELGRVRQLRDRALRCVAGRVATDLAGLAALRSRPALADPHAGLARRGDEVVALRDRARRRVGGLLDHAVADLAHTRARVHALSPAATLERGYAVVQRDDDGAVVRSPDDAPGGTALRVRVAGGELGAEAL